MPYATCQWSPVEDSRPGWMFVPPWFSLREKAISTMPTTTSAATALGQAHEPRDRLTDLRPPPVRATRWTFLLDDALPIAGYQPTRGPRGVCGARRAGGTPGRPARQAR